MEIDTLITVVALVATYVVLFACLWTAHKHILSLQLKLQDLMQEYKMCQASVNGDYVTAGLIRNGICRGKENALKEPVEESEDLTGLTITQN